MFYQITEIINVGSSIITTYINMILLFQEIFASNIEVANNFIIIPEIPERLTKSSIESNSGLLTSEHFLIPHLNIFTLLILPTPNYHTNTFT